MVSIVLREIVRAAIESAFDVLAYCFMPDHLHLLAERTLRSEERVETVAKYIEANPVRAGLVHIVDEWPHTGGTLLRRGNNVRPD